jgi:hypothetical protein
MLKWATILSTVMVGAATLSAADAHAFPGGAFGHFTPVYRLPNRVISLSFRGRHEARVIPTHPPQVNPNTYRQPPGPLPCPPGQVWGYWPALQGYACSPMGHVIGPR